MKRILAAAVTAAVFCGCGQSGAEFRNGVASQPMAQMNVPTASNTNSDKIGHQQDAVQGQVSGFYALTIGATTMVNGGTGAWLEILKKVVESQPTSCTSTQCEWGPYNDALSLNAWELTVIKVGTNQFTYTLQGKDKSAPDSAFVSLITGNHTSTGTDYGQGSFTIDWDAAATLPQHDANVGQASFNYSRDINTQVVTVDASFTNIKDGNSGQILPHVKYSYTSNPGEMQFSSIDANGNPWNVRTRWMSTGDGRADAQGTQGANVAQANECWDSRFNSQYEQFTVNGVLDTDPSVDYGVEATNCAFIGADYSNLN